jgi:hypothetical protein
MASIKIEDLSYSMSDEESLDIVIDESSLVFGGAVQMKGIEFIYRNGKYVGYYDHDAGVCVSA